MVSTDADVPLLSLIRGAAGAEGLQRLFGASWTLAAWWRCLCSSPRTRRRRRGRKRPRRSTFTRRHINLIGAIYKGAALPAGWPTY